MVTDEKRNFHVKSHQKTAKKGPNWTFFIRTFFTVKKRIKMVQNTDFEFRPKKGIPFFCVILVHFRLSNALKLAVLLF
jgi:hypothetical protein